MNYLSVCSGIDAASIAWHPLGWKPVAFAEIEKFPSAVLAHHWPDVPNLGDMTKYDSWKIGAVDLLVGGTPCQAWSVAGLKRGLNDARGNLALTFCEIADHFEPEWIVWENVPGVLSDRTNAFGCLLGRLCGAGDALMPSAGRSWPTAGLVSGPSRTVAWRVLNAQYFGVAQRRLRVFVLAVRGPRNWRCAAALFPVCDSVRRDPASGRESGTGVAGTLTKGASNGGGWRLGADEAAAGHIVPFSGASGNIANCLTRREGKGPDSDATTTLVAFRHFTSPTDTGAPQVDITPTLRKSDTSGQCVEFSGRMRGDDGRGYDRPPNVTGGIAGTVDTVKPGNVAGPSIAVRRLTPRECERLQGFPDEYTAIPKAADGPRYAAIGNSMAVPVMRWIAERIEFVNSNY